MNSRIITCGWVSETLVPSYDKGRAPKEPFFATKPEVTQERKEEKEVNRSQSYLSIKPNIEIVAQAIRDNYGCVLVVNGENNGTWRTTYPKPPKVKEWGHFVYGGKVKSVKGRRFIGVKNSWGNIGEDGWQWIGEAYFDSGHVREGWTHQWDYEPAKVKVLLKQTVNLYTQLLNILKSVDAKYPFVDASDFAIDKDCVKPPLDVIGADPLTDVTAFKTFAGVYPNILFIDFVFHCDTDESKYNVSLFAGDCACTLCNSSNS